MKLTFLFYSGLLLFSLFFCYPTVSSAHRLNVFAWLEGNQVVVDCNFGRTHPASNAKVRILDSDTGKILLEGRAGKNGAFSFPVPKVIQDGHGIAIEVDAGQGHFNEWKLDASELYSAASLEAGFDQAAIVAAREQAQKHGGQTEITNSTQTGRQEETDTTAGNLGAFQIPSARQTGDPASTADQQTAATPEPRPLPATAVPHDAMRGMIEEAVASQIRPVHQAIARQGNEPGIVEIIGGLGWIVGIVGIYLYFRSRRDLAAKTGQQ